MKLLKTFIGFFILTILVGINNIYAQSAVHVSRITQNLITPVRLALDNADNIYATDVNQKLIAKYDAQGNFISTIASGISPLSIAIDKDNQIFIGDNETGKILKLNPNGTTSVFYSETLFPSDMVFCPDGLLYIVDSKLKKVVVLNSSGNLVRTIGSGTFFYPTGIAYNHKTNRILISEHGGLEDAFGTIIERIWIFDLQGNYITYFGRYGNINGRFYRIQGMSVDRCGNIYVPDPFQGNVSVFNENGVFITKFGVWGEGAGQINVPLDIAINSNDTIWMTSMNNGALDVYKINFSLPTSDISSRDVKICTGDTIVLPVNFTGTAPWSFTYTINGLNPTTINGVSTNPYSLNVSKAGIYKVTTLSDSSKTGTCFSGTPTVTVDSLLPSAAITSGTTVICTGNTTNIPINLSGTAPWSLTYTIDSLNPTTVNNITDSTFVISAFQAGTYEVTSLSGSGCKGSVITGNHTVALNPMPTTFYTNGNGGVANICTGETTDIPISFTGTGPWNVTYSIDDAQIFTINNIATNPYVLQAATSGTYKLVEVTDGNCTKSQLMGWTDVVVHSLPVASLTDGDVNVCNGGTTNIHVSFTGTPPYNFTYTKDAANPVTITNVTDNPYSLSVSEGVYEITALSGAYCTGTSFNGRANVVVANPPTATMLSSINTICTGENAIIAIDFAGNMPCDITYTRNGIDSVTVNGIVNNPYYISVSEAGTYQLSSVSAFNCPGVIVNGTASVIVNEAPTATIASGSSALCMGTSAIIPIDLTGSPPFNFTYTKDGGSPVNVLNVNLSPYLLTVNEAGTYQLTSISSGTCAGTNFSGTAIVAIAPMPVVNLGSDIEMCQDQTFTLDAGTSFANYQWNDLSNNQTLVVSATGNYSVTVTDSNGCKNSDEISVIVNERPTAAIISGTVLTCFGDPAEIYFDFTGVGPFSFVYTKDGTNPVNVVNVPQDPYVLEVTEPGMYALTTISNGSCAGTSLAGTAVVTIAPLPVVNLGMDIEFCQGDTITLDAGASFTNYQWSGGLSGTNQTLSLFAFADSVTIAENYSATVTDTNGCVNSDEIIVTMNMKPTAAITSGSFTVCEGDPAFVSIDFTGTPPYNFTYTRDGANDVTILNTTQDPYILPVFSSGTYALTAISNGGCTGTSLTGTAVVITDPLPVVNLGTDIQLCQGDTFTLDAGVSFAMYQWNDLSSNQTLTVNSTGNYSVMVTDNNGCKNSDAINVKVNPLPIVNLGADIQLCQGDTSTLDAGASFVNFQWNDLSYNQTLNVSAGGNYSVVVTDSNGCKNSDELAVNVLPLPVVSLGADIQLCQGDTLMLDAGASFANYQWSDLSANQILAVTAAGNYSVMVIDNNGCKNSDAINVNVNLLPLVNLGTDIELCQGDTITLDAGSSFTTYQWNDLSTNQTLSVGATGNYSVSVTDINGCTNSDVVNVNVTTLPVLSYTYSYNGLEISFTNTSTNASSYLWNFGDGNTSTDINPIHLYQTNGTYTVTVTSSNLNCSSIISETINIVAIGTSVQNAVMGISIYPNPFKGIFNVEINNLVQPDIKIEIYDVTGKVIYSEYINSFANKTIEQVDLSEFSNGIYTLRVITNEITKIVRLTLSY